MSSEWIAIALTVLTMISTAATGLAAWLWKRAQEEGRASSRAEVADQAFQNVLAEVRARDEVREKEIEHLTAALKTLAETCQAQAISIAQLTERCGQALQACEHNQAAIDQLRTIMSRRQPV